MLGRPIAAAREFVRLLINSIDFFRSSLILALRCRASSRVIGGSSVFKRSATLLNSSVPITCADSSAAESDFDFENGF
jgi:hypothetical protein